MSAQVEPTGYLDHVPANARAGLTAMNAGKPLAELRGDPSSILARLEQGESTIEIAQTLGISRISLFCFLIRHCPEKWQELATARQLSRIEECEDILDAPMAVSPVFNKEGEKTGEIVDVRLDGANVSRAREKAKIAQWHLERANRKLFGDTKQIDINQSVTQELRIISDPGGALARRLQSEAESVVIDAVIEDPPDTVSD